MTLSGSPFAQAIAATIAVSLVSLVGLPLAFMRTSARLQVALLGFSAGVLLGSVFLGLLPEAAERAGDGSVFTAALLAMLAFFLLERAVRAWSATESAHAVPSRYLILIGDGVHNFIDGVAIAVAFVAGTDVGIAYTIAVIAHEVPQEIADYAILVSGGFRRGTALALNVASGLTATLGAAVCFWFEGTVEAHLPWFIAATAGMFLYIAACDLIPELHHPPWRRSWLATLPLLVGVALVALLRSAIPE